MTGDSERSMAAVLADIAGNIQHIVGAHIRLAKAELALALTSAKRGATLLIIGGAVAVLAVPLALLACVYALEAVVAPWIAALIVAAAAGGIGALVIAMGLKQLRQVTIVPPRTLATIEDTIKWAKTPTR